MTLKQEARHILNALDQRDLFENRSGGARPSVAVEIRGSDYDFLRVARAPALARASRHGPVSVVDLFAGAGGMTLGVWEAACALGRPLEVRYAADADSSAVACYAANLPGARTDCVDLRTIFHPDLGARLQKPERDLLRAVGKVDLLIGGPPCQGHSDLNNYSRRDDPKNHLYKIMGRAARVFEAEHVLIENVPGAAHDRSRSVSTTLEQLRTLGYNVNVAVVDAIDFGVAQNRKRLIVVASRSRLFDMASVVDRYRCPRRDLRWAIGDIENERADGIMTSPATSAPDTRRRIEYLFAHELYDLPDAQRPRCHSAGGHSYKSVYGRLRWDRPAQTITSGFYSMCMGRYVHPSRHRTITAHEAARIQFFPDYFDFRPARSRTALATLIANAVPPKLVFPFAKELLT